MIKLEDNKEMTIKNCNIFMTLKKKGFGKNDYISVITTQKLTNLQPKEFQFTLAFR